MQEISMRLVVDRFENGFAVVEAEDGTMHDIPRSLLPADVSEGDVVLIGMDLGATAERGKRIEGLMDAVWEPEDS